jgi:hypothetical protein
MKTQKEKIEVQEVKVMGADKTTEATSEGRDQLVRGTLTQGKTNHLSRTCREDLIKESEINSRTSRILR